MVIPTSRLVSGQVFDQEFDILSKGTSGKKHGTLELMVHYVSKLSQNHTYDVDCYFQMHQNSNVILYQDAHAKPPGENGHKQFYTMPPELNYYPRSCWTDLYHTIMQAKQLICITGWSGMHTIGFKSTSVFYQPPTGSMAHVLFPSSFVGTFPFFHMFPISSIQTTQITLPNQFQIQFLPPKFKVFFLDSRNGLIHLLVNGDAKKIEKKKLVVN